MKVDSALKWQLILSILVFLAFFCSYPMAAEASPGTTVGKVGAIRGTSEVSPDSERKFREVRKGDPVSLTDALKTGKSSKILLKLDDGSHNSLGEEVALDLNDFGSEDSSTYYHSYLAKGSARFIKKLPVTRTPSSYVVTTPTAYIQVMPTKVAADFVVEVINPGQTCVTVIWGKVKVKNIRAVFSSKKINKERLDEERILKSCQMAYVDAQQEPSKIVQVGEEQLKEVIRTTTIDNTLPSELPSCKELLETRKRSADDAGEGLDGTAGHDEGPGPGDDLGPDDELGHDEGPGPGDDLGPDGSVEQDIIDSDTLDCPPEQALDPGDGVCKPCAESAQYNPDTQTCDCICGDKYLHPISGECVDECPTQASVAVSQQSAHADSLPKGGCPYCTTCQDDGSECGLSYPTDDTCPDRPGCGKCIQFFSGPKSKAKGNDASDYPTDVCAECGQMRQPGAAFPCGLNAGGFNTDGDCRPTQRQLEDASKLSGRSIPSADYGKMCISLRECEKNKGYWVDNGQGTFICQRDEKEGLLQGVAGGDCGPCESLTFRKNQVQCHPLPEGDICRDEDSKCGTCQGGSCVKLPDCPPGQAFDDFCECRPEDETGFVLRKQEKPKCESHNDCFYRDPSKPCCVEGKCVRFSRCPGGDRACPGECKKWIGPKSCPSGKCLRLHTREFKGVTRAECVSECSPREHCRKGKCVCNKCYKRRGGVCRSCKELNKKCNRRGKCYTPTRKPPPPPPVDDEPEIDPCQRCYERGYSGCRQIGNRIQCFGGPRDVRCGPCQVRRGNRCVHCEELGFACRGGRCVDRPRRCGRCEKRYRGRCVPCSQLPGRRFGRGYQRQICLPDGTCGFATPF